MVGGESARPALLDHVRVGVHTCGGDAACPQEIEEFAASAPQIEDVRRAGKAIDVVRLPRANLSGRSTEQVLESDVAGAERFVLTGDRCCGARLQPTGLGRNRGDLQLPPGRDGGTVRGGGCHAYFVERRFDDA
jgi:hypothetical protein